MKKSYLYLAAAIALASCANDDYVGGENVVSNDTTPIAFSMNTPATSRAEKTGGEAAGLLDNEFIVWGEKNEADGTAATDENLVFKNYRVDYTASTAYTTTSNTKDWEYVGITPYEDAKVSPAINGTQTIKYWDMKATSYTFTAVSALKQDITDGKVKIEKATSGATATDKGYTITLADGASAGKVYVADRLNVTSKQTGTINREAENQYGGLVKLTFRNFQSKVRFAMYEVIPGYTVKIDKVTFNGTDNTTNFGVDGNFVTVGANTKYKVTYNTAGKALVAVDGTPATATYLQAGTNILTATALGTSSLDTDLTYDNADKSYTAIMPNPTNDKNIKVKVSYTLTSEDTGEKIVIENKTAEVPAAYCQWQSNYAYTYIFKITDNAADLYPITFDAVVAEDEVAGTQETITTVTEPSITTFAVDAAGKVVTGKNEYEANNVIYASVVAGGAVVNLTTTNVKLYTVTTADADKFPITSASVANAVAHTGVTGKVTVTDATGSSIVTEVPSEVSGNRTISALKWTGAASTTYAVEYTYTEGGETKKVYKIVLVK